MLTFLLISMFIVMVQLILFLEDWSIIYPIIGSEDSKKCKTIRNKVAYARLKVLHCNGLLG